MSYAKYSNRDDELEPDVFDIELLYIDSYGLYEDLTFSNTFGVEKAFWCEEFN